MRKLRRLSFSAALLGLACCARPAAAADDASRDQVVSIPVHDVAGVVTQMQARICRPAQDAPARLVVINHGSPPNAADRPKMTVGACGQEAARWFVSRGYVVVFPLRRGYGATGGDWAESYGRCNGADYVQAGLETARDIAAAVAYATALPFVRPTGTIVVGQSAGGWGAIAYDSMPHPNVSAIIAMAGGRGGHYDNAPNTNCHPELLARAAGRFGVTASTPMLWVYAANDSFFAPQIAEAMHAAFVAAGGKAVLMQPGPFDGDGHRLFFGRGGSAVWGPMIESYLAGLPG